MLKFNPKRVSLELTGEEKPHTCFWVFLEIFQEKITQFCQTDSVSGDELNGNKYNLERTLSHNPD